MLGDEKVEMMIIERETIRSFANQSVIDDDRTRR